MPDLRSHFCVTKVYFYIILSLVVTYSSHFCVTKIPLSCLIRPFHQIFPVLTAQPGSLPLFFFDITTSTLSRQAHPVLAPFSPHTPPNPEYEKTVTGLSNH